MGVPFLACHPDLGVRAHARNQVLKPGTRLREKLMPPPGDHEQAVEVIEEAIGATSLV